MNTYYRCHVDDATFTLLHHDGRTGMDEIECRFQIDIQYGIPLCLCHTQHQIILRDTGIIDQNIHTAKILHDVGNHLMSLFEIGRIGGITFRFDTQRFNFLLGCQAILINDQIRKRYVCTFCCKLQCDRFTDTTSSTRYNRYFTF